MTPEELKTLEKLINQYIETISDKEIGIYKLSQKDKAKIQLRKFVDWIKG